VRGIAYSEDVGLIVFDEGGLIHDRYHISDQTPNLRFTEHMYFGITEPVTPLEPIPTDPNTVSTILHPPSAYESIDILNGVPVTAQTNGNIAFHTADLSGIIKSFPAYDPNTLTLETEGITSIDPAFSNGGDLGVFVYDLDSSQNQLRYFQEDGTPVRTVPITGVPDRVVEGSWDHGNHQLLGQTATESYVIAPDGTATLFRATPGSSIEVLSFDDPNQAGIVFIDHTAYALAADGTIDTAVDPVVTGYGEGEAMRGLGFRADHGYVVTPSGVLLYNREDFQDGLHTSTPTADPNNPLPFFSPDPELVTSYPYPGDPHAVVDFEVGADGKLLFLHNDPNSTIFTYDPNLVQTDAIKTFVPGATNVLQIPQDIGLGSLLAVSDPNTVYMLGADGMPEWMIRPEIKDRIHDMEYDATTRSLLVQDSESTHQLDPNYASVPFHERTTLQVEAVGMNDGKYPVFMTADPNTVTIYARDPNDGSVLPSLTPVTVDYGVPIAGFGVAD
ncbi:MAG: hypothetical protein MI923_03580, partial [Phycisphaerales bacterium]|nr:hypothetical protein [Phycisphaerales bacterium]